MAKNLFKNSNILCPIKINSTYYPESQTMELEILEPEVNMQRIPVDIWGLDSSIAFKGNMQKSYS